MKKFWVVIFFWLFPFVTLAANLPMTKGPVSSGVELAEKLKEGKANASPQNYADSVRHFHPEAEVKDIEGLYLYLQNLEIEKCPQGVEYRLSSITPGKKLGVLRRMFRSNEKCLIDRNTQKVVASASCGNVGAPVVVASMPPTQARVSSVLPTQKAKGSFFDNLVDPDFGRVKAPPKEEATEMRVTQTVVVVEGRKPACDAFGVSCGYGGCYDCRSGVRLYGYFPGHSGSYTYERPQRRHHHHRQPPPVAPTGGPVNPPIPVVPTVSGPVNPPIPVVPTVSGPVNPPIPVVPTGGPTNPSVGGGGGPVNPRL